MNQDRIKTVIQEIIKLSGLSESPVELVFDEEISIWWCSLGSKYNHLVSGKNADTLSAVNYLVRRILEKDLGEEFFVRNMVLVDINDQTKKKIESLRTTAHMMAERARYFKSSIDVDPMPAFERRIMHEFLSQVKDIKTESVGEGKNRHMVVKYVSSEL